ncbi:MAG: hypothetical protein LBG52_00425 [Candidatus Peribacteria bacterium]|jgi:hypothetical protein|nr:hypothetical protein [Candidatus Peribacteria bacterium]
MFLGGTIITLAVPSSLNDIKSTNTNNQLTAENRDYLIDQVKVGLSNVASSLRIKNGDNVYYTGMVGIGTTPNNLRSEKLQVDGSGRFSGEVAVVSSLRVGKSQMSPAPKMYIDNTDANYSLYINNQSGTYGLYVIGTGRNYLKGNVGIGTTPSVTYALNVNGTGNFSKPLYAPTPTSSSTNNQVATKGYVDNQSSSQKPTISTHIVSRQTYGQSSI